MGLILKIAAGVILVLVLLTVGCSALLVASANEIDKELKNMGSGVVYVYAPNDKNWSGSIGSSTRDGSGNATFRVEEDFAVVAVVQKNVPGPVVAQGRGHAGRQDRRQQDHQRRVRRRHGHGLRCDPATRGTVTSPVSGRVSQAERPYGAVSPSYGWRFGTAHTPPRATSPASTEAIHCPSVRSPKLWSPTSATLSEPTKAMPMPTRALAICGR